MEQNQLQAHTEFFELLLLLLLYIVQFVIPLAAQIWPVSVRFTLGGSENK